MKKTTRADYERKSGDGRCRWCGTPVPEQRHYVNYCSHLCCANDIQWKIDKLAKELKEVIEEADRKGINLD